MPDDESDPLPDARTFAFVDAVARLKRPGEIAARLLHETKPYGLDVLMAAWIPPARAPTDENILLDGWPEDWRVRYRDEALFESDPIAQFGRHRARPFVWSEVPAAFLRRVDPGGAFMARAREHGFKDGYCIPMLEGMGRRAIIGLAGSDKLDLSRIDLAKVELMALYAMRRAADLIGERPDPQSLSPREREALYWAACGETNGEIAKRLVIREATVISHLSNARRKLGAANTTQAVALALDARLIRPP